MDTRQLKCSQVLSKMLHTLVDHVTHVPGMSDKAFHRWDIIKCACSPLHLLKTDPKGFSSTSPQLRHEGQSMIRKAFSASFSARQSLGDIYFGLPKGTKD